MENKLVRQEILETVQEVIYIWSVLIKGYPIIRCFILIQEMCFRKNQKGGMEVTRERIEKELSKVQEQLSTLQEKQKELEKQLQMAKDTEKMKFIEKHKISLEQLILLNRVSEEEILHLLKKKEKEEEENSKEREEEVGSDEEKKRME